MACDKIEWVFEYRALARKIGWPESYVYVGSTEKPLTIRILLPKNARFSQDNVLLSYVKADIAFNHGKIYEKSVVTSMMDLDYPAISEFPTDTETGVNIDILSYTLG